MGDKADLSGSDFLEYWEQDPDTAVLLLYLDSFGNPRRFGRIARRITRISPSWRSRAARTAGGRAASSHTGALLAAADVTVDALFAHAGVLRAETVSEMFDVAGLLARQPLPRGDRVAVLTNAGGRGRSARTPARRRGCVSAARRTPRASSSPRAWGPRSRPRNPVDMTASATPDQYERSLRVLLAGVGGRRGRDDLRAAAGRAGGEVARGIAAAAEGSDRPVLAVWLGADAPAGGDGRVPRFPTPEEAVRALAHAVRHARRRTAPPDPPYEPADADTATAATTVAKGLGAGEAGWRPGRSNACCAAGHPGGGEPAGPHAADRGPGRRGARRPCRAEGGGAGALPQERRGSRALGLTGRSAVIRAAVEMARQLEAAGTALEGFRVQRMAPEGPS